MAGAFAGILLTALLYRQRVRRETALLLSRASSRSRLTLGLPELAAIGRQLRRASHEGPAAPAPESDEKGETETVLADTEADAAGGIIAEAEPSSLLYQSSDILDKAEPADSQILELDLELDREEGGEPEGFPEHIFRAYDIRGHADTDLSDELVYRIGRAVGEMAAERGESSVIVGGDGRISTPRIRSQLISALLDGGLDVIDIGLVPTPLLYFATQHLDSQAGIMVTGSHNPRDDNGLKIVLDRQTMAAGGIQDIRRRMASASGGDAGYTRGRVITEDIVPAYIDEVAGDIAIAVPLKIVIDAGNGATSDIAPRLFTELGCEVIPLYCEIDGNFPNHPPDTSDERNLDDLCAAVRAEHADFGVAFDGDGDRVAVVTGSGAIVRADLLMMLFAQDVVSRNPGADVVFDVKCTRHLARLITHNGGRPVLWKTGHALMKQKIAETGALLGGEFSGHIFFGERWYGHDDGMYAAGRLAEILSTHDQSLDAALEDFPRTENTPEILVPVEERKKFALMQKIAREADFGAGKVNNLDGIRVDFDTGWGLLRASNTSAALTARFEADTAEHLEAIKRTFREQVARVEPELQLPF
ncbi:phosphomannomutase/phosphoglucomutase [Parahaliea mediterranea]|uniref:phosphomannomutase n=2 Tax=Parahaliea mediterranea TaxID=651086 RepID=A0A939DFG2_9GAMM|nr:phosphomannomutase/phosphoglucomutase [Parahaliea mediterranea]